MIRVPQPGRVDGKKALVTGAAQGLGEAIARLLAKEGATVVLTDVRSGGVEVIAKSINSEGHGRAFAFAHDVRDESEWQRVLKAASAAMGGINVLVNNAGIGAMASIEDETTEGWRNIHAVNVDGVFFGCKHAIPLMRETGTLGAIVNISSIAGLVATHNHAAYNSSKAAVWMLTKSIALHGARSTPQIRCNSVHPTYIKTPILDGYLDILGEDAFERLQKHIPLRRLGRPEDVAYAVLYLASDESSFVTGAEFKVDGGVSAM